MTMTPSSLTVQALLNCLVREVSAPEYQARQEAGRLVVRLPRAGALLRARLLRPSGGLSPRLAGEVEENRSGQWCPADWRRLARLIETELTLATGERNDEFAAQVRDSHAALTAIMAARADAGTPGSGDPRTDRYLASEQALVAGHRFHPAPKARQGGTGDWLRYAPEARARFPLRFLAVRADVLAGDGDASALDRLGGPEPPDGYHVLPAHPWQLELLAGSPWLRRALRAGLMADLGPGTRQVVPTSSVRTVYDPAADMFCKFSLGVRITNCVRTSAWYELASSVELSRLLVPVFARLAVRYPGAVLLAEPGYRTVAAASKDAYEGLAVIVREGIRGHLAPDVTPLLAASLTEPGAPPTTVIPEMSVDKEHAWWEAYLRLLVPPVLDLLASHGVVLEPHLQNVIVGVDAAGMPAQVVFRDLEGAKLVRDTHAGLLAGLPPGVAHGLGYERERAWNRVLYCLVVNHLAEVAAAIADRAPGRPERTEADLWARLREVLAKCCADLGRPPRLRAVLAGAPLPAKANLRVRWARAADRAAGYVTVPSPWAAR
jgi:siderophore synthetase component